TLQTGRTGGAGIRPVAGPALRHKYLRRVSCFLVFRNGESEQSVMTTDDHHLLNDLGRIGETLGPFSFSILTNTLSITDQLDFSHKLIAAAGRIRARVEKTSVDHRYRPTHGDAP
ncbi:MAG: hypothetical protein LC799_23575, partial [Actinobacteria bacterium]|nr:hypothetical protein [Actinomycetota bacterium]